MLFSIERQKEHFKNHVATFTDYGNIKILDFKEPGTSKYRIRFLFEEDYHRIHISGDLGELIATNHNNMCYEGFSDFVHNTEYFREKIDCHSRELYEYDYDKCKKELEKLFESFDFTPHKFIFETEEEIREKKLDEILDDFDQDHGIGTKAYEALSELDEYCYEYVSKLGKVDTGILEVYMLAFELAQEQLKESEKHGTKI